MDGDRSARRCAGSTAPPTAAQRYAATQFEAADARRAFPCFDEPEFKARFTLELVHDAGLTAIANGAHRRTRRRLPTAASSPASPRRRRSRPTWSPSPSARTRARDEVDDADRRAGPRVAAARPGRQGHATRATPTSARRAGSKTTPAIPVPVPASSTPSASPTSRPARWRTPAPSPTGLTAPRRRSGDGLDGRVQAHLQRGGARADPHVVGRPGHHGVVERSLAERVVRVVRRREGTDALNPEWGYLRDIAARRRRGRTTWTSSSRRTRSHMEVRERASRRPSASTPSPTARAPAVLRMIESFIGEDAFREGVRIYLKPPRRSQRHRRRFLARARRGVRPRRPPIANAGFTSPAIRW